MCKISAQRIFSVYSHASADLPQLLRSTLLLDTRRGLYADQYYLKPALSHSCSHQSLPRLHVSTIHTNNNSDAGHCDTRCQNNTLLRNVWHQWSIYHGEDRITSYSVCWVNVALRRVPHGLVSSRAPELSWYHLCLASPCSIHGNLLFTTAFDRRRFLCFLPVVGKRQLYPATMKILFYFGFS
jgi:hypothetical protein